MTWQGEKSKENHLWKPFDDAAELWVLVLLVFFQTRILIKHKYKLHQNNNLLQADLNFRLDLIFCRS